MGITDQLNKTFFNASGSVLTQGAIIRAASGVNQASTAFASTGAGVVNVAGVMSSLRAGLGSAFLAQIAGETQVLMETGLTPVSGQQVFVSASVAGRGTNVVPVNAVYVGYITDVSKYASQSLVTVVLQLADSSSSGGVATWTGTRYYAVDNELGLDSNAGYSDASMAAAGVIAIKTPEQLALIVPPLGNPNQVLVLAFKGRTGIYVGPDGVTIANFVKTLVGYGDVVIRSTDTFSDDVTDQSLCAAETVSGPYTVDAGSTTSSIPVVGGGLPTDRSLQGYRIRFTSGAVNGVLAYFFGNTASAIASNTMSAAPAAGVTFVIEKPSVELGTFYVCTSGNDKTIIAGIESQTTFKTRCDRALIIAFCNTTLGTVDTQAAGTLSLTSSYLNRDSVLVSVGAGFRYFGSSTFDLNCDFWTGFGRCSVISSGVISFGANKAINIGSNSYIGRTTVATIHMRITGSNASAYSGSGSTAISNSIGRRSSTTSQRFTIGGSSVLKPEGSFGFYGVALADSAQIWWSGVNLGIALDDVTGTTTEPYPFNFESIYASKICVGTIAANTVSGTEGAAFAAAGSNPVPWATFDITNVIDVNGNNFFKTALNIVSSSVAVLNASGAAVATGDVLRGNGTGNQATTAQADSLANAQFLGVVLNAVGIGGTLLMSKDGFAVANFDGAPTPGAIAYLSPGTARALTTTIPVATATNQKLRVGRVIGVVSGTLAKVALSPENLAVLADGLA